MQTVFNGLYRVVEVRTQFVHLIDEANTGNIILIRLTPNGFRLGLYALFAVENGNCTVEDAQGALYLNSKVNVTRGINDVNLLTVPKAGSCRGCNGDSAFFFLFHPVHGAGTIMGFPNLVVDARVVQDAFSYSGFTSINVCHDADVANLR